MPMSIRHVTFACVLLLTLSACGAEEEVVVVPGVIDRETFIEAFVDLRVQTLESSQIHLTTEERDRILASHGVDAEDLVGFVDAYGRELDYINHVWSDIAQRLDSLAPAVEPGVPDRESK